MAIANILCYFLSIVRHGIKKFITFRKLFHCENLNDFHAAKERVQIYEQEFSSAAAS